MWMLWLDVHNLGIVTDLKVYLNRFSRSCHSIDVIIRVSFTKSNLPFPSLRPMFNGVSLGFDLFTVGVRDLTGVRVDYSSLELDSTKRSVRAECL